MGSPSEYSSWELLKHIENAPQAIRRFERSEKHTQYNAYDPSDSNPDNDKNTIGDDGDDPIEIERRAYGGIYRQGTYWRVHGSSESS